MSYLDPLDRFFLTTERQRSPWHGIGCEIFELPSGQNSGFVARLVGELRSQQPVFPFDSIVGGSWIRPEWKRVDVDMTFHVRHQVLPPPGGDEVLMEAVGHHYASLLDRNAPLWECCVYEGLSENRFAITYKVHHALTDGQGALKIILNALNLRVADRRARAPWADNSDNTVITTSGSQQSRGSQRGELGGIMSQVQAAPRRLLQLMQSGGLSELRLFRAPRTPLNHPQASSARRFGFCDLSLSALKDLARRKDATVNDVLLYCVDAAVQRDFRERNITLHEPLVCGMPVSTRSETSAEGGNQAALMTVTLGAPEAEPTTRLQQIRSSARQAKDNVRLLPGGVVAGYTALVLATPLLLSKISGLAEALPIVNLGISNISPPRGSNYLGKSLYCKGAKLQGLYIQPNLPPAVLLVIAITSIGDRLCFGIGSTPDAIGDPMRLGRYIVKAADQLAGDPVE